MKFRKARVFGLGRRGVSATVVVAFAIAGLPASAPGANAIPIVTRVAGNVSIQSNGGGVRSVGTAERTNEGDTLTTQANGLADVVFADVGRARVGPASVARVQQTSGDLAMRLVSGALCVNVEQSAITIAIGNLAITSGAAPSVFSVVEDAAGPSIVVYEGQVKALGLSAPVTASAGDAFAIDAEGNATLTDFAPLQKRLAGLKCPAADMIAHTQKLAANPPALGNGTVAHSGGGGAGAALGILGGLG
ncbi:MAG: hypothetical protein ACREM6_08995, partial [Vulcanimicrobiaceae bacterium]